MGQQSQRDQQPAKEIIAVPQRPLLILPQPALIDRPKGSGFGAKPRVPTHGRQVERLDPIYASLRRALTASTGGMELRSDPTSIAPERAIVFEVAGRLRDFYSAVGRIEGLRYLGEDEIRFDSDEDFAEIDEAGRDKAGTVSGRQYLAMPNLRALEELLSLYEKWSTGQTLPRKFAQWRDLFSQLKTMRRWGPQDRITDETIQAWAQELREAQGAAVRIEAELWFHNDAAKRNEALQGLIESARDIGANVTRECVVPEIAYHGALIDVPADRMHELITRAAIPLVLADQAMFLRPQAVLRSRTELVSGDTYRATRGGHTVALNSPIAALFDAVPVQNHVLLAGRLEIDDPDGLEPRSVVTGREHGTEMASLIIHGDLDTDGTSLARRLYVRPLMFAVENGREETDRDQLLIETVYRAVVRLKSGEPEAGIQPSDVFIVNLSMGDARRPFANGPMSPWGRLLDYLSHRYGVLFIVSAGNILAPIPLNDFDSQRSLEAATPDARTRAVLTALSNNKATRTLLSPAEALNPIVVGSCHDDNQPSTPIGALELDPLPVGDWPNATSGMGLGHRRAIKPDIVMPGGRERLRFISTGPLTYAPANTPRGYGLRVAATDFSGQGRNNQTNLTTGTSAAAALATRTCHQIFDTLMDSEGGSNHSDMDPAYWPVVTKALLVHSAKWDARAAEMIQSVFGPNESSRHEERKLNTARLLGFGRPDAQKVLECSPRQATLVGYGDLTADQCHEYKIPLPDCLASVTDPRSLVVTMAWFSPVSTTNLEYRKAQLFVDAPASRTRLGVGRSPQQPGDKASSRGTVVHERYEGDAAVPFIEDGHLILRVWCVEKAGRWEGPIRYGLAVTIEAGTELPVYDQVAIKLRQRVPTAV